MNKFRFVLIVFVLTVVACGGAPRRNSEDRASAPLYQGSSCDALQTGAKIECLERQNAVLTATLRSGPEEKRATPTADEDVPHRLVSARQRGTILIRNRLAVNAQGLYYVPLDKNGNCGLDTYNLEIENRRLRFLEVRGKTNTIVLPDGRRITVPTLLHCGDGQVMGLVGQNNGQTRFAFLIPPGGFGKYLFLPWNGGTGVQRYWVDEYAATAVSILDPLDPQPVGTILPAPHVGTWSDSVKTPFETEWWLVPITNATPFS